MDHKCPACSRVLTGTPDMLDKHIRICVLSLVPRDESPEGDLRGPTPAISPVSRASRQKGTKGKEDIHVRSSVSDLPPPSASLGDEEYARYLAIQEGYRVESRRQQAEEENERLFHQFMTDTGDENGTTKCELCHHFQSSDSVVEIAECGHSVCGMCLRERLVNVLGPKISSTTSSGGGGGGENSVSISVSVPISKIPCFVPGCGKILDGSCDIRPILTSDEFERYQDAVLQEMIDGDPNTFVKCPECGMAVEKVNSLAASTVDKNEKGEEGEVTEVVDDDGKLVQMSRTARQHLEQYRLRCHNEKCKTVFCCKCNLPYHYGRTCEEHEFYLKAKRCRFCDSVLPPAPTLDPKAEAPCICDASECVEKGKICCEKVLDCGHQCCGLKGDGDGAGDGESKHLPCLKEDCDVNTNTNGGGGGGFCNICWVETLDQAPCVLLECGHIFHYRCVQIKLERRWTGARITFGFADCPLCNEPIRNGALAREVKEIQQLKQDIQRRATKRLEYEGMLKDKQLYDTSSRYCGKPTAYAMDRFAYYMCFKCKQAYFGGQRRCEEAANDPDKEFDASELVCGGCATDQGCPVHGKEFLEFKCRWCCQAPAVWFCWGTSHFCTSCHRRQMKGEFLNRLPRDKLPQCPGDSCSLKIPHPAQPGDEFCIGCFLCRQVES